MTSSALASLVDTGQLKEERTSPDEMAAFLGHAAQSLRDAAVPGISSSGRFEFSYTAAHALALAALRAHDLRPEGGRGHRAIVFQSLAHTIGAPATLWSTLNRYHTKRNKSEYGSWSETTDAEAADMLRLAGELEIAVVRWIREHRPNLLG